MAKTTTRMPRASFAISMLDDPDFIILTMTERGELAAGIFFHLVMVAKAQSNAGIFKIPLAAVAAIARRPLTRLEDAITAICEACELANSEPWLFVDKEGHLNIRNFKKWNSGAWGGSRDESGRKPEETSAQAKKRASRKAAPKAEKNQVEFKTGSSGIQDEFKMDSSCIQDGFKLGSSCTDSDSDTDSIKRVKTRAGAREETASDANPPDANHPEPDPPSAAFHVLQKVSDDLMPDPLPPPDRRPDDGQSWGECPIYDAGEFERIYPKRAGMGDATELLKGLPPPDRVEALRGARDYATIWETAEKSKRQFMRKASEWVKDREWLSNREDWRTLAGLNEPTKGGGVKPDSPNSYAARMPQGETLTPAQRRAKKKREAENVQEAPEKGEAA